MKAGFMGVLREPQASLGSLRVPSRELWGTLDYIPPPLTLQFHRGTQTSWSFGAFRG